MKCMARTFVYNPIISEYADDREYFLALQLVLMDRNQIIKMSRGLIQTAYLLHECCKFMIKVEFTQLSLESSENVNANG